jgi:hypothetical protein
LPGRAVGKNKKCFKLSKILPNVMKLFAFVMYELSKCAGVFVFDKPFQSILMIAGKARGL